MTVRLPGGVPLVMVRIRGGVPFMMGSPADERGGSAYEMPQHLAVIAHDFYIGSTEVTQAQWQAVMGSNPSLFTSCGADCPVERVSWDDVAGPGRFIEKLNEIQGVTRFWLPSEAEWEYAARAGTTARFSYGDVLDCADSCLSCATHAQFTWWCGDAASTTHAVGLKLANPWGLFDVHGNVWEWVQDCWHDDYTGAPPDSVAWEESPCTRRVYRGGGWFNGAGLCRSAQRNGGDPGTGASAIGFRLASTP